ncbi:MAG: hypothetical protein ACRC0A_00230 [Chitinophagaceae bacterium]
MIILLFVLPNANQLKAISYFVVGEVLNQSEIKPYHIEGLQEVLHGGYWIM